MRLRIHRGANEIGGSCVELEAQGQSILLDLGLPLDATDAEVSLLPHISGLMDGSNPNLLGVILSHTHGDHHGLTGLVHPSIPVFMGARAETLLRASRSFVRYTPQPQTIRTYASQVPFDLGPFRITPFLTDHSGFDAYSLLVEADGKRVFYSGDLRAHGRKAQLVEDLIRHPPRSIDVLLLEGTTLRRADSDGTPETEQELEGRVFESINGASGLVLAVFSPQNIDRFVTIFRASRRAGRTFIADVYLTHILDQLALPSLPRADQGGFRVYLPDLQKRRIIADKAFDLVSRYRRARIYREEMVADPARWVMLFRESMMRDIERLPPHTASTLLYSLWPGYLQRGNSRLEGWCREQEIAFEIVHTSGHADPRTLARLAQALNARMVVPIHTDAPLVMKTLIPNVRTVRDGDWLTI
jgi:ribonuclease J